MTSVALALLAIALRQGVPATPGSTPPSGDTVGYWQQRVHYRITATLDERAQRVRASGTLLYVNNSPDTLRALYFHQYLNAFRPGSRWSAVDEREGRERFQRLEEPDFGYERFTAPVRIDGAAVVVEYPGAPDSTVARVVLPGPLAPHDSVRVAFEWDARPSTVPRRQARRGRHWDLAQWYPKVAVYDRGGWQYNALQPAGELYGEFGTYDVTLIVANDQVLGATGVPVSGDPGWSRVIRTGSARLASDAYGDLPSSGTVPPAGFKAVRFYAKDVHHFAWTASPDYRYEGGTYVRRLPESRFQTWDSVAVHVLYRAGDDTTWGGQRVLRRTIATLQWLEGLYGPYAYPQVTVTHRIDGGGTEMPMMVMNGSPSQGLILHEVGHIYTYGILANNEWRSAWMDEGLTSYQTAWAQLLTPKERVRAGITDQFRRPSGYRGKAIQMLLPRYEVVSVDQTLLDLHRRAQPIATMAQDFRDFETYNDIVYDRAEVMYSQLRDLLGDTLFVGFLHDYYARWALKHVDERAMRASAERVSGRDLGWFFDQWLRRTGVMDYRLGRVRSSRDSSGAWITQATVQRRGEYRHAMSIGVRTSAGWTFAQLSEFPYDGQTLRVTTANQPLEVRLDPYHTTWDWDRRNDVRKSRQRQGIDWPFLSPADRDRSLGLWRPMLWYSRPGELNAGLRAREHYLGSLDQSEVGAVWATGNLPKTDSPLDPLQREQIWLRFENPYLPFLRRPAMGWRGGAARLDDVLKIDLGQRSENLAKRATLDASLNYTLTQGQELLPEAWIGNSSSWSFDLDAVGQGEWGNSAARHAFLKARGVIGYCDHCDYEKSEVEAAAVLPLSDKNRLSLRAFGGVTSSKDSTIPKYRALYVSAQDPLITFENHWWRPREGILKRRDVNWLPLGGGALRGYHWSVTASRLAAANIELAHRLGTIDRDFGALAFWLSAFGDAGYTSSTSLIDAGPGLKVQGRFFDQPINVRFDFPVYVSKPALAIDRNANQFAPRWVITFNDIW